MHTHTRARRLEATNQPTSQPTSTKMANKDGLRIIRIFAGFDNATAHYGHMCNTFCQMCVQ